MEKLTCYSVEMDSTKIIFTDIDNALEAIKIQVLENVTEGEKIDIELGVEKYTQKEINEMPECDEF